MKRYKKGEYQQDHDLATIFGAYEAKDEPDFVKKFFKKEELIAVLESCGIAEKDFTMTQVQCEHPVTVGTSSKRADLTIEVDNTLYYFEVMSQSHSGRWDNDHHEQFYLKSTRFKQLYDEVYSFAVAFKEFDPRYLEEFQKMDDWYAIHLRFNDKGYFSDVYGVEDKRQQISAKIVSIEKTADEWRELLAKTLPMRKDKNVGAHVHVGHAYQCVGYTPRGGLGIELKFYDKNEVGIKVHYNLLNQPGLAKLVDEKHLVKDDIQQTIPDIEYRTAAGRNSKLIKFVFDVNDKSKKNVQTLIEILQAYAKSVGIENLLAK